MKVALRPRPGAISHKPCVPCVANQPHRLTICLVFGGHDRPRLTRSDPENNVATERYLLRCPQSSQPLLKLPLLLLLQ